MQTPSQLIEQGRTIDAKVDEVGQVAEGASELQAEVERLSADAASAALFYCHAEGCVNERSRPEAAEWMEA